MGDAPTSESEPAVTDLESAKGVIAQLQALLATLNALVAELRASLASKDAEIAELRRALPGPKSERKPGGKSAGSRRPPLSDEEKARRRDKAERKRAANRDQRKRELESLTVEHEAPKNCPRCGSAGPFTSLSPELSDEIEYIEERLRRLVHTLEKNLCSCGHIFTASGPARVTEGCLYGPGLHAYAVVPKCADALPPYRITKRFARARAPCRSTSLSEPQNDPKGPPAGPARVHRGQDYGADAGALRTSARTDDDPAASYSSIGLRCCRSVY